MRFAYGGWRKKYGTQCKSGLDDQQYFHRQAVTRQANMSNYIDTGKKNHANENVIAPASGPAERDYDADQTKHKQGYIAQQIKISVAHVIG